MQGDGIPLTHHFPMKGVKTNPKKIEATIQWPTLMPLNRYLGSNFKF